MFFLSIIKLSYLISKNRLITLSSQWLTFQLQPNTQTFLNNLFRSQKLSNNPPKSDLLYESKLIKNPIPSLMIEVY